MILKERTKEKSKSSKLIKKKLVYLNKYLFSKGGYYYYYYYILYI